MTRPTLHDGEHDDHINHPHGEAGRCLGDAGLSVKHREALDRLARLQVLLGEMKVDDPVRPFTLEDIFKQALDRVAALVRNHGLVEAISQAHAEAQQRIDIPPVSIPPVLAETQPRSDICIRKGCGQPMSAHEYGLFCP